MDLVIGSRGRGCALGELGCRASQHLEVARFDVAAGGTKSVDRPVDADQGAAVAAGKRVDGLVVSKVQLEVIQRHVGPVAPRGPLERGRRRVLRRPDCRRDARRRSIGADHDRGSLRKRLSTRGDGLHARHPTVVDHEPRDSASLPQLRAAAHGGTNENLVEEIAARRKRGGLPVDGRRGARQGERTHVEIDVRHGVARVGDLIAEPPSPQARDAALVDEVRRRRHVARKGVAIDEQDLVTTAREQHRDRTSRAPGSDDYHIMHGRSCRFPTDRRSLARRAAAAVPTLQRVDVTDKSRAPTGRAGALGERHRSVTGVSLTPVGAGSYRPRP